MGDQGKLYVNPDVVPVYKTLLHSADLILPNQFEAEYSPSPNTPPLPLPLSTPPHNTTNPPNNRTLSSIKITSLPTLLSAIAHLHLAYQIPHIIITSVSFTPTSPLLSIIGSTSTSMHTPRFFKIDVPAIDCFFSGTGDMFAALTVVRFREAITTAGLGNVKSWVSPDGVKGVDLPLARAAEKVLASMHAVLVKTKKARDEALVGFEGEEGVEGRLRRTKAAEVRLVRNLGELKEPRVEFWAEGVVWEGEGEV